VTTGQIKSNGKTRKARRLDAKSFVEFQLGRKEVQESNASVERKMKKHVR
jgi:hypothetical protein